MVITRLIGGFGNQMFQYAIGRHLAERLNDKLLLDISDCVGQRKRNYELGKLKIIENVAARSDIENLKYGSKLKKILGTYGIGSKCAKAYVREEVFHYNPLILELKGSVYLEGYWQSENYFREIRDILVEEFSPQSIQNEINQAFSLSILQTESVSIHVRRGDYVSDSHTKKTHGICNAEYYSRSIDIIRERVKSPHFFVFSDDPDWAKRNIKTKYPTEYISHNLDQPHEDLRLMKCCRYHIIANSTFSWWGAWLCEHQGKFVICPQDWFSDKSIITEDLIPSSWIRV